MSNDQINVSEASLSTSFCSRLALGALVAIVLVLPSAAHANTTQCFGRVQKGEEAEQLRYSFTCDTTLTAYSLTFDQEIGGFEPEVPVLDNGNATNDLFSCEGDIPSFGVGCFGNYSQPGKELTSTIDLPRDACASPRYKAYLWVVSGAKSQMAGPFPLRGMVGCKTKVSAIKRLMAWIELLRAEAKS